MTKEEAIFCEKSYIGETNCVDCKYYGSVGEGEEIPYTEACHSRETHKMAIKALEQELKTGHWLTHKEYCDKNNLLPSGLGSYFWCSECDCGIDSKVFYMVNYNYCPNCGAKMVESQESGESYADSQK